jgi:hypothetical protein
MPPQGIFIPFPAAVSLSTVYSVAAFTLIIKWRDTKDKIGWPALTVLAALKLSSVALLVVVSSKDCWLDYQGYQDTCHGLLLWNSGLLGAHEVFVLQKPINLPINSWSDSLMLDSHKRRRIKIVN